MPGNPGNTWGAYTLGGQSPDIFGIFGSNSGDLFLDSNGGSVWQWNGSSWSYITNISGASPDTGWSGNDDVGDKTVAIASDSAIATTVAQFSGSGFDYVIINMAKKLKALEAALASHLLPNA